MTAPGRPGRVAVRCAESVSNVLVGKITVTGLTSRPVTCLCGSDDWEHECETIFGRSSGRRPSPAAWWP